MKLKNIQVKLWESPNISETRYSVKDRVFEVTFIDGLVYQYMDVPLNLWFDSRKALSIGSWMHQNLKGHFRYAKVK